jgi:hypothetical protein
MLLTLQWFTDVTNFPPNTDKRILKAETAVWKKKKTVTRIIYTFWC